MRWSKIVATETNWQGRVFIRRSSKRHPGPRLTSTGARRIRGNVRVMVQAKADLITADSSSAESRTGTRTQFGYRRHPDQDRADRDAADHPIVVVGAGPVGLSLAIDLAQRGQRVVLLDDADRIGEGSRAICFSKRSLEYWDRLGVGQRMVDKGVVWSVGKIFHGASQFYQFNLLPENGHKRPAFINL